MYIKHFTYTKNISEKIVFTICICLSQISPSLNRESVKTLVGSLLLCLAEYCIRMGVKCLKQCPEFSKEPLILIVFKVRHYNEICKIQFLLILIKYFIKIRYCMV